MDKYYGIHIVNIKTNGAKMINPIIEQIEQL